MVHLVKFRNIQFLQNSKHFITSLSIKYVIMKFWTSFFELSVLLYFSIEVILLIQKKKYLQFSTLITGAIFGVVLEFVNVFLTQAYTYSQEFILQVGIFPNNIPLVIGLAWGILLETSHQISECFNLPIFIRTLFESVFVVSVDLFLDVVAIRLDGGFWIWTDEPIVSTITTTSLLGIGYGNFYGWFCVIFFSSIILHLFDKIYAKISGNKDQNSKKSSPWKYLLLRITITVILAEGLLFVFLNILRFAPSFIWLFFVLQYFGSILILIFYMVKNNKRATSKLPNVYSLAYYMFSYFFCIITMIVLGLIREIPVFFALNVVYGIGMIIFLGRLSSLQWKQTT
ncbi:hypothetical protein NEF87_001743 [Candidatus Lokiarchaeum ossiferum]|uniref:Carotenoid biosynthesis protein n=1 Tax=Candidatus Lokiarchaeum ossiferum TaxID=2951803 RepID=A0ABY6HPL5_9ARCH|nr:hypothetical protein NEF87_001743 [Candidatus Lokiarchaeum sp. B-35]